MRSLRQGARFQFKPCSATKPTVLPSFVYFVVQVTPARIAADLLPSRIMGPLNVGPAILTGNKLWLVHLPICQYLFDQPGDPFVFGGGEPAFQFRYQFRSAERVAPGHAVTATVPGHRLTRRLRSPPSGFQRSSHHRFTLL